MSQLQEQGGVNEGKFHLQTKYYFHGCKEGKYDILANHYWLQIQMFNNIKLQNDLCNNYI